MRDQALYLNDILLAMESIQNFTNGMNFTEFERDDKTSSAVVRKLEILGEAAKQVSEEFKNAHPDIPWKDMAGMRDRLIHSYFGIDYHLVWQTIREKIPGMLQTLKNCR